MNYAIITNGKVENIIEADSAFIAAHWPDAVDVTDQGIGIDDAYDAASATFTAIAPKPVAKAVRADLSKVQFYDLFTDTELASVFEAARKSGEIEVWVERLKAATEVHLDNPQLIRGIKALEAAGLIATGRAAEILI